MKFVEDIKNKQIITKDKKDKFLDNTTLEIMAKLEKTQQDFWNVDLDSANFINLMVKITNAKSVLELGTSNGYSAIWIAKALKEMDQCQSIPTGKHTRHLTTLEFWDNRLNEAIENFKKCSVNDIITTKLGSAATILENMLEQNPMPEFDFVFIDANKSEYVKYFNLVHPMVKKGGVILADNIMSHYTKVEPYVKAITGHPQYQSQLIPLDTGMLLSRKT